MADQTIIDVVSNVNTDLRHNGSFVGLLKNVDEETAREIARQYIEFLYRMLQVNQP